jgi:hypothetical protein
MSRETDKLRPQASGRNRNRMAHLTEFELDELLLGDASPEASAHLADCTDCSARLDAVAQPLASFGAVSLAWAQQRSASMPLPQVAAKVKSQDVMAVSAEAYLSGHLDDDQLDAVMIQGASPAAAAHLAACDPCTGRLAAVEQPIASFRAVSLAWSERRSATMPLREENFGRATAADSRVRRWGWVAATAAALAVATALTAHRSDRPPAVQTASNTPPAATSQTKLAANDARPATPSQPPAEERGRQRQIDADNQMLAAIDHELDASQATLASFGVEVSASRTHSRTRLGAAAQQ